MNKYALIGAKLGHSYSKIIHNYVFNKFNLKANYELIETTDLAGFVLYAKSNLKGFNVTIPYKEKILPYLDEISEEAKILKNVNTVKNIDGKLYGYNTDYAGFLGMLNYYNIDYSNKDCYILGSGGAAKTCFNALKDKAKMVKLVSRSKTSENIIGYDDLIDVNIDLLINATPVGMYPDINSCPVNDLILNKTKEVVDLIYNPKETKFLKAKNSKHDGLIMLIIQALEADKIWENIEISKELIKEVGDFCEQYRTPL